MNCEFQGLRCFKSAQSKFKAKPGDWPDPAMGQNCMEDWCISFLVALWWCMRMAKTITSGVAAATGIEKDKCKKLFGNLIQVVLSPSESCVIPIKLSSGIAENAKSAHVPSFSRPDAYIPLNGSTITSLDNLLQHKQFSWLRHGLKRSR